MTSIECRLHGGAIHAEHCAGCEFFDSLTWHCLYYITQLEPQLKAAAQERAKAQTAAARDALVARWRKEN